MDLTLQTMLYGVITFGLGIIFAFFLFYSMAKIGRNIDDKEKS